MPREWLADIGGSPLLDVVTFEQVLGSFRALTGENASGIVYPAVSEAGPNWKSGLYPFSYLANPQSAPGGIVNVALECRNRELSFWLDVSLSMGFAATSSCNIVDPSGSSSAQCCINSPGTQQTIALLLEEAVTLLKKEDLPLPSGVVLTLQNLWPMGATENFIEHTCFCSYCTDAYEAVGFKYLDRFKIYPNPINLGLATTSTGMRHVHAFGPRTDRDRLIEYSRAQGFLAAEMLKDIKTFDFPSESAEWARLQEWATILLAYIGAKQQITFAALSRITQEVRHLLPAAKVAVVVEPLEYDWTAGFFFETFLGETFFDEFWTAPDANLRRPTRAASRIYSCSRARYLVQNLFQRIESSRARFRGATPARDSDRLRSAILSGSRRLEASMLNSPLAFKTLPIPDRCNGIVAPIVSAAAVNAMIEKVLPPTSEQGADELETLRMLVRRLSEHEEDE